MKRIDIQALRGFAVLGVLLFHLQITQVKGGFLGVDIFFVISGFVITERLARDSESGKPFAAQIRDFYGRRAKRILPASLFVILLTTIFAKVLLAPISLSRFSFDAIASTLFAGNIRFALQGNDYLNQSMSPTPFLHYWSLGVEEQFYLLWPILFLLFVKGRKWLVMPLFMGTSAFAIWFTHINAVNSFYFPISRAWEFLAGIGIALLVTNGSARSNSRRSAALLGWVGASISILIIGSAFATPGISTLLPVASAALILISQQNFRWLKPLAWVGDYSFAIYLIHWPLVVLALDRYQGINAQVKVEIAFLSLLLGYLISKFVENPFRFNPKFRLSLTTWTATLAITVGVIFAVSALPGASGESASSIDLRLPQIYADHCHLDFGIAKPSSPCIFGDIHGSKTIVLAGDSHAAQWFDALNTIAINRHWKLLSLTKSSCPASLISIKRNGAPDISCTKWRRYVIDRVRAENPYRVFLTSFSEYRYALVSQSTKQSYATQYADGAVSFIRSLGIPLKSIYYIEDTPHPDRVIPECISKNLAKSQSASRCDFPLTRTDSTLELRSKVGSTGVAYLNLNQRLCPENICLAEYKGFNLYRDSSHLSVSAATTMSRFMEALI